MYASRPQAIISNDYYQKELCQYSRYCQLIAMCLLPGEQIPLTTEPNICKVWQVMSGTGVLNVMKDEDSKSRKHLAVGMCVMVYPGSSYRIMNNGNKPLKMLLNNTPPVQGFENVRRPEQGSNAAVKQPEPLKKSKQPEQTGNKRNNSQRESVKKNGKEISKESKGTTTVHKSNQSKTRNRKESHSNGNRTSQRQNGPTKAKTEKRPRRTKHEVESEESGSEESSHESC